MIRDSSGQLWFQKLRQIEWDHIVNRPESLLLESITDRPHKLLQKLVGIDWQPRAILRFSNGDLFHSQNEISELQAVFKHGGLSTIGRFRRSLVKEVGAFDDLARSLSRSVYERQSQRQLYAQAKKFFDIALCAHAFLTSTVVADRALSDMITNRLPLAPDARRREWLFTLTFPTRESSHTREQRSFLALAAADRTSGFERLLNQHVRKFGWIGARWYRWGNAWTTIEVEQRVRDFIASRKDPRRELRRLVTTARERSSAARLLRSQLKIHRGSELDCLISMAQAFAYLRTWRTDVIYRAGYYARNLWWEIARRAGLNPRDVTLCTYVEVLAMVRSGKPSVSPLEFEDRRRFYVGVGFKRQWKLFAGRMWEKKFSFLVRRLERPTAAVRGTSAYPGRVRGRAVVVRDVKDLSKVRRGDIMIAVMTFPHFIAAMEKAAAFVTDEGGILCHAAIVAREMRKPCVIGTKIATKVLKDGDLVEVDANKGIVQKLGRG